MVPLCGGLGGAYSGGGGGGGGAGVEPSLGLTIKDWVRVANSLRLNTSGGGAETDGSR